MKLWKSSDTSSSDFSEFEDLSHDWDDSFDYDADSEDYRTDFGESLSLGGLWKSVDVKIKALFAVTILVISSGIGLVVYSGNPFSEDQPPLLLESSPESPASKDDSLDKPMEVVRSNDFDIETCESVIRSQDWVHYWSCVEGDVRMGSPSDDPVYKPAKIESIHFRSDEFKSLIKKFDIEGDEDAFQKGDPVYFDSFRQMFPMNPDIWVLTQTGGIAGVFYTDPEFIPESGMKALLDTSSKATPARLSSSDPKFDGMVGVLFRSIEDCGTSVEECEEYYVQNKPKKYTGTVEIHGVDG